MIDTLRPRFLIRVTPAVGEASFGSLLTTLFYRDFLWPRLISSSKRPT